MSNAMYLSIMLDLMLYNDLIWHAFVILADCFGWLEDSILQLLANELLIGEVDFGHNEGVLLLPWSMRSVEDMAEPVLIIAVTASFRLADPPFNAKGRPLELLGVQCLIEVGCIPPPYEFLVDLVVEGAFVLGKYLLHMPPIMRYKIRYLDIL